MPDHLDDEILYYGGSEKMAASQQRDFVPYFRDAPGKILEVGCGRGAMLSLLKDEAIASYGIDLSATTVEYCRSKGLEVIQTDVFSHLRDLPAESLGGIFCAHVIEHMQPTDAIEFLRHSHRVLRTGGNLILITPHAKDLRMTERFWMDITHVRPYPEKLLRFLLERQEFAKVETFANKEPASNVLERITKMLVRMWFLGYMFTGDLVAVAER